METSLANSAEQETFDEASDSGSSSNEPVQRGRTILQTNKETQNLFSVKADYELAEMIGEIIELLEEGKTLRESFEDENYYEELFMSSAKDFASQLKKKCNFLFTSIKDALINMTNISR